MARVLNLISLAREEQKGILNNVMGADGEVQGAEAISYLELQGWHFKYGYLLSEGQKRDVDIVFGLAKAWVGKPILPFEVSMITIH